MDEKTTTFGLNHKQLAKLMTIGTKNDHTSEEISHDHIKAGLLRDVLDKPLGPDFFQFRIPNVNGVYLTYGSGVLGLESVREVLFDPETDCSLLTKIKKYYNHLSRRDKQGDEHDIEITIYFAALAAAMVIHHDKISSFSYESLEHSFSTLVNKSWMSSELITLFTEGINLCREASDVKESPESKEPKSD